jgi:hypothetical protein
MENSNFYNPTYEQYYQHKFALTFGKKTYEKLNGILCSIYPAQQPTFSCSFFQNLLKKISLERKQLNWSNNFIQKIDIQKKSKLVVFGTTQGGFHALVRYLSELKTLKIIDEKLKITNPDYYLVFLGNVVNRSPHTLEIFTLVLKLLQQNPYNVIYLKGVNEHASVWKNNTLGRELTLGASRLKIQETALEDDAVSFFDTLPTTLYCSIPQTDLKRKNFIKIAPFIESQKLQHLLQENNYIDFLNTKNKQRIEAFHLSQISTTTNENIQPDVVVKAMIVDIRKRESYEEMDGLRLLPPAKGITTWTVLSTSAEAYRRVLKFFYDAFVIITPSEKLFDWEITLYNRDIRNIHDRNFKATPYYFFTGERI